MENQEPLFNGTEEQKKKLKLLYKSFLVNSALINFKFTLTLFAANFAVILLDGVFVHNKAFVFGGCLVNFFLSFRSFRTLMQKEHDRIKLETKKILEN